MTKIVRKCFLTGDTFIPQLHLRQPVLTYSACGPFTKHRKRSWKDSKFRQVGDLSCIYKNYLDKACFVRDAAYVDGKNLAKRTISGKVFEDRAYEIALNQQYDG